MCIGPVFIVSNLNGAYTCVSIMILLLLYQHQYGIVMDSTRNSSILCHHGDCMF